MNNDLIEEKNWWNRNWKWIIPVSILIVISISVFFSSRMDGVATDLVQAYMDTELYENAIIKANSNTKIVELLGEIQPIDNLAILEGEVEYTNNNKTVYSSVRIVGTKGKANMDISAERIDDFWNYTKINIPIKSPPEKRQTINLLESE